MLSLTISAIASFVLVCIVIVTNTCLYFAAMRKYKWCY